MARAEVARAEVARAKVAGTKEAAVPAGAQAAGAVSRGPRVDTQLLPFISQTTEPYKNLSRMFRESFKDSSRIPAQRRILWLNRHPISEP